MMVHNLKVEEVFTRRKADSPNEIKYRLKCILISGAYFIKKFEFGLISFYKRYTRVNIYIYKDSRLMNL